MVIEPWTSSLSLGETMETVILVLWLPRTDTHTTRPKFLEKPPQNGHLSDLEHSPCAQV